MTTPPVPPSDAGTRLAVDRTRLAYERTMMAWIRTSTSLISFGFSIHKFFQYRAAGEPPPPDRLLGPGEFGGIMITTGIAAVVLASIDHRRTLQRLRAEYGPQPASTAASIGILIGALGVAALVALLTGL